MLRISLSVVFVVCASSLVHAQPRRARSVCVVANHTLASPTGTRGDLTSAPEIVLGSWGSLVVWRTGDSALFVGAYDRQWRPVMVPRELSRPVGAFSMAPTNTGAAVAYVEREREVVLARINAHAEAQNVPRLLVREEPAIEALSLVRSDDGFLLGWATSTSAVRALTTDARGVERMAPITLGRGRAPRLTWINATRAAVLRVDGTDGASEATALSLDARGTPGERIRWPTLTLGPLDLPTGLHVAQMHDGNVPLLLRIPAGATVAAPDPPARATVTLHSVASEGTSVYALVRDPRGARHLVVRVQPEPTCVATVNLGTTSQASLAVRDGVVVVVHHEPAPHNGTRLIATTVTCPS